MAITANSMIVSALGKIQVLGIDANITAQEAADGLYDLNSMLDAWGIERLLVYQVLQSSYSWTANASSKTIGSGGDFSASRPIKISQQGNFFRDTSNLDYPVVTLPRVLYDPIPQKSATGSIPEYLYFDDNFPTRTLYVYPVPDQTLTLYLNSWKALQTFSGLTTAISLPPGYQAAIEWNLAIWSAPRYGAAAKIAAKDLEKQAALLKTAIKGINTPNLISQVDPALMGRSGRRARIESDT